MALIMGYQVFYYGPRMQKVKEALLVQAEAERQQAEAERQQTEAARDEAEGRTPPRAETGQVADPVLTTRSERETGNMSRVEPEFVGYVTVTTPLYRIVLSTAGGDIVSAKLLQYETHDVPVELINWRPGSAT